MKFRVRFALLLAALTAAPVRPAAAGDPPPPDFARSMAEARAFVDQERWASGEAALRKIFTDFPSDARVRAHVREIEDKLKVCLFRRSLPPLTGADLFGAGTKRFDPQTREVEFATAGLTAPLWRDEGGISVLSVRLDTPLTIEADLSYVQTGNKTVSVLICYDLEKRGGYVVAPGYYSAGLGAPSKALKIGPKGKDELKNSAHAAGHYDGERLTISRAAGTIVAKVGKTEVVRAQDSTYVSGLVGVDAESVRFITVKGRVENHAYRKMIGERFSKQFAEWEAKSYRREKELPEWAREAAVAAPDVTLMELPSDASAMDRSDLVATVEAAAEDDPEAAVEAELEAKDAAPDTALYLHGVAELALGSYKDAESALSQLVAAEPEFVPARLFRGIARFHLRRLDEAKADLAWTLERRPRATRGLVVSAMISIFEQDFAQADVVLAKAAELGVSDRSLDRVRDWVHRAEAGPNFTQRYSSTTDHFVVVSDHSQKISLDVAKLLESMQPQYAAALRPAPARAPRSRVYVFSGPKGYFDYAADLHVVAHSTSGIYLPMLRELAIWIPEDMTDFTNTVRHEGFHQYLHRLVDDAPTWFNEGSAEFMGGGGPEGIRNAKRDGRFVSAFVPVRELVAMKHPAFMKNAGVAYTQSRYLVDFLRGTKSAKLKNVLRDYFAAVSEGLTQEEVNARVLAPVMDVLEAEFKSSL